MTDQERIEMVAYRIKKSLETLDEVKIHIENELWTTAVNRLYYACFYAVSALLLKNNIKVTTHSGTRQMLGLHFVKTELIPRSLGKFYSEIFDMRHTGDYDDFVDFSKEEVMELIEPASELISTIEKIV
jgi:uncharacterized protein (UPF0332 family)